MKHSIPQITSYFLVLFLFITTGEKAFSQFNIAPKTYKNSLSLIGNKSYTYYEISDTLKTKVVVQGPGILVVNNRAAISSSARQTQPYTLGYTINGRLRYSHRIPALVRSKELNFKDAKIGIPSISHRLKINIPPGKHTLLFSSDFNENQKLLSRFIYQSTQDYDWEELSSLQTNPKVFIVHPHLKKKREYTRIDAEKGFVFRSDKHTKVRIYFRAEFNYKLYEQSTLRFKLLKNGNCEATYKATCFRSDEAEYETERHFVPSTLRKYYIDLDVDRNDVYELILNDPNQSAIVRVFLGKPSVSSSFAKL